jgi:hypothetical protein
VHCESVGDPPVAQAGSVHVIYGMANGLNAANDQIWHQDITGVDDSAETNDCFGYALAAGDFGDGRCDLTVGVPMEDREGVGPIADAGVVKVAYGTKRGLSAVVCPVVAPPATWPRMPIRHPSSIIGAYLL